MRAETAGGKPIYAVSDDLSPESFYGDDLKSRRTPDDIVHIHDEAKHQLGPGLGEELLDVDVEPGFELLESNDIGERDRQGARGVLG